MTYLVTGARGLIGSWLVPRLDDEVIALDLKDDQDILTCDLPDADVVFHLAANTNVVASVADPHTDARNNVLGTARIADRYKDSRVIYTASAASIDPQSPYGVSKLAGEKYVKALVKDHVILRFPNIYDKDAGQGLIPAILKSDVITIYGDGAHVRDYIHVSDAVSALLLAIKWKPGEYSLSTRKEITVLDVARATKKPIHFMPERAGEKHSSLLPPNAPGWSPTIDVIEYIQTHA